MQALSDWYYVLKARPGRPRLFCFPFAGGGASMYRGWGDGLGDVVEAVAARTPGRESRLMEPAIEDVVQLAHAALDALMPLLVKEPLRPYALFGHSLGALVVYEMARELVRRDGPRPMAVFASGHSAPDWKSDKANTCRLPRDEFIAEVGELAGTPKEVLADAELMELLLPTLRADFIAAQEYANEPGPQIDVPLYVYSGSTDDDGTPAALEGWTKQATRPPVTRVFEGGHFFIDSARQDVFKVLAADLREVFGAAHSGR